VISPGRGLGNRGYLVEEHVQFSLPPKYSSIWSKVGCAGSSVSITQNGDRIQGSSVGAGQSSNPCAQRPKWLYLGQFSSNWLETKILDRSESVLAKMTLSIIFPGVPLVLRVQFYRVLDFF